MTDRYAVFGNPVAHSKSPQIHALFAAQTGADISYEAILAPVDGFNACVLEFAANGAQGANVTVPFKEPAFRLASQLTARATAAGAVNTLLFADEAIVGDNTDGAGLVRDIESNLGFLIRGKSILLLGAGGAARGVVLPLLAEAPAALCIVNRTAAKARQLTLTFSREAPGVVSSNTFEQLAEQSFDLVINATSAGLHEAALPLPDGVFASDGLAYEMVYGRETMFMQMARQQGAQVSDGLGMLVEQAAESFLLWRGRRPDTSPVLQMLRGR